MDFIGPLPSSSNRDGNFDSITIVIGLLTAMVELIPSQTNYTAPELTELIFEHVYKYHGDVHLVALATHFQFLATFTKNIQCRHLIDEQQPKQEHSALWQILIRSLAILTPIGFISNRHTV